MSFGARKERRVWFWQVREADREIAVVGRSQLSGTATPRSLALQVEEEWGSEGAWRESSLSVCGSELNEASRGFS